MAVSLFLFALVGIGGYRAICGNDRRNDIAVVREGGGEFMIEVLPIGTMLGVHNFQGRVNRITVGIGNFVEYEIAYWEGNERKTQWVPSGEIVSQKYVQERTKIGFKT